MHVHLVGHVAFRRSDLRVEDFHDVRRAFHALDDVRFGAGFVFPFRSVLVALDVGPAVARIVILTEATMRKVRRKSSKHLLRSSKYRT